MSFFNKSSKFFFYTFSNYFEHFDLKNSPLPMDLYSSKLELAKFTIFFCYVLCCLLRCLILCWNTYFSYFWWSSRFFGVSTSSSFSVFAATIIASPSLHPLKHSLHFHSVLLLRLMIIDLNHYNKGFKEAKKSSTTSNRMF